MNVTYKCNNRCTFCATGTRTQFDGDFGRQRELLVKYRKLGVSLLDLDGGEPTLNPNLFSLVASCKLHALDPEAYLADVIRVMPYWPRDRYLELAPKYWARTRVRLDAAELARPLGHISVPGPLSTEEQASPG